MPKLKRDRQNAQNNGPYARYILSASGDWAIALGTLEVLEKGRRGRTSLA